MQERSTIEQYSEYSLASLAGFIATLRKSLISSHGFEKSILEKGDFKEKIVYFPNWADKALEEKTVYQLPALPDGFIAMFAGNIGEAQDFETLMEAARLLKDHKDIHFVIVGDGRKRPWVEAFVQQHSLQDTVHCVGATHWNPCRSSSSEPT